MRRGGMPVAARIFEDIVRERSLFRPRDVEARGISRNWMEMMIFLGVTRRVAPGIYGRPGVTYSPEAIAAVKTPRGVACLTSALRLHGWTDVPSRDVWWAIPRSIRKPKSTPVPTRFLRLDRPVFEREIENVQVAGVNVRVYSLERTLIDCLRWRRKLGPDEHAPWWERVVREYERARAPRDANLAPSTPAAPIPWPVARSDQPLAA